MCFRREVMTEYLDAYCQECEPSSGICEHHIGDGVMLTYGIKMKEQDSAKF